MLYAFKSKFTMDAILKVELILGKLSLSESIGQHNIRHLVRKECQLNFLMD